MEPSGNALESKITGNTVRIGRTLAEEIVKALKGAKEMRLIDADALYMELSQEAAHRISQSDGSRFDTGRTNGIICARDSIKSAPTIEPVKHGHWKHPLGMAWNYVCSECGASGGVKGTPFCPNCGAKNGRLT